MLGEMHPRRLRGGPFPGRVALAELEVEALMRARTPEFVADVPHGSRPSAATWPSS